VRESIRWAFVAATVAWAAALPLAAAAASTPHPWRGEFAFAFLMYGLGGVVCHQRPERSFHLWGVQLPVCARCAGIYVGAALAAVIAVVAAVRRGIRAKRPLAVLVAAWAPVALTLVFEWTTGVTPSNMIRALSGLPAGAAVAWLVLTEQS